MPRSGRRQPPIPSASGGIRSGSSCHFGESGAKSEGMAILGRTERRLAFAIVLTAVIPLIVSIYFANSLVDRTFAQVFTPELGEHLDQALGVYQDLAKSLKEGMRYQADAIAAYEPLRTAALLRHSPSLEQELAVVFPRYPNLMSLGITMADGT